MFALICVCQFIQKERIAILRREAEKKTLEYQRKYESLRLTSDNSAILSKMQYYIEGKMLENIDLEKWTSGEKVKLYDVLTNRAKLVFYISEEGCTSCYIPYLKKISLLAEKYNNGEILLFAYFKDKRTLKSLLIENQISLDVYRMHAELSLFPKDNSYPILFLLSNNNCIDNAFVADKSNLDLANLYLEAIKQKLH